MYYYMSSERGLIMRENKENTQQNLPSNSTPIKTTVHAPKFVKPTTYPTSIDKIASCDFNPKKIKRLTFSSGVPTFSNALKIMLELENIDNYYESNIARYLSHITYQCMLAEQCVYTYRIRLINYALQQFPFDHFLLNDLFNLNGGIMLSYKHANALLDNIYTHLEIKNTIDRYDGYLNLIQNFTHAKKYSSIEVASAAEYHSQMKSKFLSIISDIQVCISQERDFDKDGKLSMAPLHIFMRAIDSHIKHQTDHPNSDVCFKEWRQQLLISGQGEYALLKIAQRLKRYDFHLAKIPNPHGEGNITQHMRSNWMQEFIAPVPSTNAREHIEQELRSFLITRLSTTLASISTSSHHMPMTKNPERTHEVTFNPNISEEAYFMRDQTPKSLLSGQQWTMFKTEPLQAHSPKLGDKHGRENDWDQRHDNKRPTPLMLQR